MSDADRVTVHRRIAAPAGEIFAVICNPDMHEHAGPVDLGKYQVLNTVTRIEPGRALEWNVGGMGSGPLGHFYGYELVVVSDGETDVIHYCDWSGIPDEVHDVLTFPVIPVHMLEASLENLDRIVTT
jgi:hypothetical protein